MMLGSYWQAGADCSWVQLGEAGESVFLHLNYD